MREMPEVRHPLPLSNSGFQELIHVLLVLVALWSTTQVHNAAF